MNEKIEVPTMQVPPLKKICMTIGQLPTSYLETMSYYEMLVWFVNYLRDDIIPVVNANGQATEELQELYVELQSYVNNYFDNLDIQEEVDAKLDEMAESGQLTDIIAQYLGLAGMITFNTVAEMKLAENLVNGSKCATLGYTTANDKGNALYKIRNVTNEDVIDESTIIALHDVNLVAELIIEPVMNNTCFGTGLTSLQKAIANCEKIYLCENLTIAPNTLTITGTKEIDLNGHTITMSPTTNAYANLITSNTTGKVLIKNGKLDGNYSNHTLSSVTNHTGLLCLDGICEIDNVEICNCYYEGIIINSTTAQVILKNSYIHTNGRNDIAVLSWLNFECDNCVFDDQIGAIDPIANIDCEPYEAGSEMGQVKVTNCIFKSTGKMGFDTYLDANQTKSASIYVANCTFYNRCKIGYDRGKRSFYTFQNNTHYNQTSTAAFIIKETCRNVTVNDTFNGCYYPFLIDLAYTWGTIENVNINCFLYPNSSIVKSIEFVKPEGTITNDNPFSNFNININNNKIVNWHYLHNSTIKTPPLITTASTTLDFTTFNSEIYMTGYSTYIDISGIYNKSKNINPKMTIYSDVSNTIRCNYFPTINENVGVNGIIIPGGGSSFSVTFHNYNYNKFIIDNIEGIYTPRSTG